MAARTLLFLPFGLVLLLYIRNLLALVADESGREGIHEGGVKLYRASSGSRSVLQVDGFTSPLAADSSVVSSEGKIPSPVQLPQPLIFDPPSLDFREEHVGMPKLAVVKVVNPSQTQTLQLTAISGDSPDFHPSFFKSKVVKPGDSTIFDVMFLARAVGAVQNTLYIHTSLGTFDYKVQGVGSPNPFRLRPLLGARIPLNATYSPLITMYNPYNTPLQITEMYSSGGELHLELLTGQNQGSRSLWEIRPYETKPIARANIVGQVPVNHTSFIRIKTSHALEPSIVLPVEVEVSENTVLFLSRELLDFGIIKSGESKPLPIFVLNSGPHQVHIRSISVVPENPAIEIEYTTTSLKPGTKYSKIASVTFHADRMTSEQQQSGRLIIQADDKVTHQLEVTFEATVLQGSLSYEKSQTLFRVGNPPFHPIVRNLTLSNHFDVPVVLYDVRLPSFAKDVFSVVHFHGPFVLPPSKDWYRVFSIRFLPTSSDCLFNVTLRLSTNASLFNIPLHCYDGRVQYSLANRDEDVLDYRVLSDADTLSKTFTLHNVNPIRITISGFYVSDSLPYTTVELVSIHPANESDREDSKRLQTPVKRTPKPPYNVEPGHDALFRVNVTRPQQLGTFTGEILVHTSFDKILHVPVYYKTAVGSIEIIPAKLQFEPAFPYGVSKMPLHARNLYPQPLKVLGVSPDPEDPRFFIINERIHRLPVIKPNALTEVGTLVFDPMVGTSQKDTYLGVTGKRWKPLGKTKPRSPDWDVKEINALWDVWMSVYDQGLDYFNFTFLMSTEIGPQTVIPVEASLVWPRLVMAPLVLDFPTTTIGNTSVKVLELWNPSDLPVTIQPLLLHHYARPHTIVDTFVSKSEPELANVDFSQSGSFSIWSSSGDDHWRSEPLVTSTLLPPHGSNNYRVEVAFSPSMDQLASNLLLIRNNLTVLDYVLLQGQGSRGTFTIDGIQPGTDPLLFEFSPSLLEKCQNGHTLTEPMKLTRHFRMHNLASSHVRIVRLSVGGAGCEEHRFSVGDCKRLEDVVITTNKSRKIEISFTPDFTQSRVSNTLRIQLSDGRELLFPLLATLPHHLLGSCYAAQPRPEWERKLVWFSVPFWLVTLVFVILTAIVRSGFKTRLGGPQAKGLLPSFQSTGGKVFDLSDITRSVHAAISEKLASLKASVQPESLRPSKQRTRDRSGELVSGAENHRSPKQPPWPLKPSSDGASGQHDAEKQTATPAPSHVHSHQQASNELRYRSLPAKQPSPVLTASTVQPTLQPSTTASKVQPVGTSAPKTTTPPGPDSSSGLSKSTNFPPSTIESNTTDNETGMRRPPSISGATPEQLSPGTGPPPSRSDSGSRHEKSHKASSRSTEANSQQVVSSGVSSPVLASDTQLASGITPLGTRKTRGIRKAGSKTQKSSHTVLEPQTVAATTAVLKMDQLERKESESSIKSTDSESSSTTTDKSDEKEDTPPGSSVTVEVKPKFKPSPSLAKEPGTGQTVPIADASEDAQPMKGKVSPEPSLVPPKKERDRESPSVGAVSSQKSRSKKKIKQLQKKEEKLRRQEREREREKERERELEELASAKKHHGSLESIDKDSTSSTNSTEEGSGSGPTSEAAEEAKTEAEMTRARRETSFSESMESSPDSVDKSLVSDSPSEEITVEQSPKPELEESPLPPKPTKPVSQVGPTATAATTTTSGDQPAGESPVVPPQSDSVPSTAVKTSRPKTSKHQLEEILSDPFSRTPDRSTYASKKSTTSTKKQPEKTKTGGSVTDGDEDGDKSPPKSDSSGSPPNEINAESENGTLPTIRTPPADNSLSNKTRPHTLEITEVASADAAEDGSTASPESGAVETDGVSTQGMRLAPPKPSVSAPTSPHELAASLLSNNPAMMRRKMKTDKDKPEGGEEGDEVPAKPDKPGDKIPEVEPRSSRYNKHHGFDRSPQKVPGGGRYNRPPTTLSLDAEPFYPSADFQHRFHSRLDRERERERQRYVSTLADYIPPSLNAPPGFTTTDSYGEPYAEKKFRKRDHHRQQLKGMTPSPPYNLPNDGQHFSFAEPPGLDTPEGINYPPDFRLLDPARADLSLLDPEDSPGVLPPMNSGQQYAAMQAHRLRVAAKLRQQQQHQYALETQRRREIARERSAAGFSPRSGGSEALWERDHPLPSSYNQLRAVSSHDEELLSHHQQLLRRQYLVNLYRRQARKSAENISSLSQPPLYARSARSSLLSPDLNQHSSNLGNLWENTHLDPLIDPLPPPHPPPPRGVSGSMDDAFLSESVRAHQLRQQQQQQFLQERHARQENAMKHAYGRESDLGGEIVSSMQSVLQSPSVLGPLGLNRAPGSAFSGESSRNPRRVQESPMWGAADASEPGTSGSNWSSIWSLDSPFSSNGVDSRDLGNIPPNPIQPPSQTSTAGSGQQYVGSTYDLFENQGIWSLGRNDSSSLLSWAHLKSDQEKSD